MQLYKLFEDKKWCVDTIKPHVMLHRIIQSVSHRFQIEKETEHWYWIGTRIGIRREKDPCVPNSFMQLPVALDSGFLLCESVFSTVLNNELIVSATMHWVAVFWATGLDPRSWLACLFSGVSPTAVTPVTSHSSVLVNKTNRRMQSLDNFNTWWTHVCERLSVPLWLLCVNCIRCDVLRCRR